jgi:serine/threonine-protein kinase
MRATDADATELSPGQLIGKYRVEALLGRGGMAAVYRGVHVELDQHVAIKTLLPSCTKDDRIVARFVREAKTIAKIRSKHVARVFDIGRLETTEAPYIVLELLEGQDLGKKLEDQVFPIPTAVDYVIQASEGLARAHDLGIVHRDVKPGNLFLARDADGGEIVKVIDFGIAKQVATDGYRLTATADVFGSPQYMAPEQIRAAQDADARSDVWALGIVLYELLTGASAFAASSVLELAAAILHNAPTPITIYRRDIPADLERVLLRCLEKAPDKRFASANELVLALAPFATKSGARIADEMQRAERPPVDADASLDGTMIPAPSIGDELATKTTPDPNPFAKTIDRRSRWLALAGTFGVAIVGVGLWTKIRTESPGPTTPLGQDAPSSLPQVIEPPLPVERPVEAPAPVASITTPSVSAAPPRPQPVSVVPTHARSGSAPTHAIGTKPIIPRKGGD